MCCARILLEDPDYPLKRKLCALQVPYRSDERRCNVFWSVGFYFIFLFLIFFCFFWAFYLFAFALRSN